MESPLSILRVKQATISAASKQKEKMKIQVYKQSDERYNWRLVHGNGQNIVGGRGGKRGSYASKRTALQGLASVVDAFDILAEDWERLTGNANPERMGFAGRFMRDIKPSMLPMIVGRVLIEYVDESGIEPGEPPQ